MNRAGKLLSFWTKLNDASPLMRWKAGISSTLDCLSD
jgi:hypothetical protein